MVSIVQSLTTERAVYGMHTHRTLCVLEGPAECPSHNWQVPDLAVMMASTETGRIVARLRRPFERPILQSNFHPSE